MVVRKTLFLNLVIKLLYLLLDRRSEIRACKSQFPSGMGFGRNYLLCLVILGLFPESAEWGTIVSSFLCCFSFWNLLRVQNDWVGIAGIPNSWIFLLFLHTALDFAAFRKLQKCQKDKWFSWTSFLIPTCWKGVLPGSKLPHHGNTLKHLCYLCSNIEL